MRSTHDYRYETPRFLLRQVRREDAPALLACYSDPAAVALMNADNCTGGFLFQTLGEMEQAIQFWNRDVCGYARPAGIPRLSVLLPAGFSGRYLTASPAGKGQLFRLAFSAFRVAEHQLFVHRKG